jgi:hypothetical protein
LAFVMVASSLASACSVRGHQLTAESSSVYVGIDVACAVGKRLPICVVSTGCPLMPLTIPKHLAGLIPRGVGNKEITAAAPFQAAARDVVSTINRIPA